MMLKFKGKPHEVCWFIKYLIHIYGEESTLKEVFEKISKGE